MIFSILRTQSQPLKPVADRFRIARTVHFIASAILLALPQASQGQVQLGLKQIDRPFAFEIPIAPGAEELFLKTPFVNWVKNWETRVTSKLNASRNLSLVRDPVIERASDEIGVSVAGRDTAAQAAGILGGKIGEYADIGMRVQGRGELGGAWNRFSPCDPAQQFTCSPGLFPQLKPEMVFGIQVAGTISERVHVNVDYNQNREFDAANNINVFYQGFEDEVLQRLEVGDVSIRLPASRYLTQGIPAGNFGFKATGQLGPLEFQTVFAQQRGDVTTREFRLGGLGAGAKLEQDATLVIDDADYVEGQFFYLVQPDSIRGNPHIDALALRAADASPGIRPAQGASIQIYRDERPSLTNPQQQAQLGYFLADADAGGPGARKHSGLFRRLLPDQYIVHPSGLWIMLRAPLRADEALAISYLTESGDTVGTINAENTRPGTTARLRLLRGPVSMHQPGQPTWNLEMHNVYRLDSSSNVDPVSIDLKLSVGEVTGGRVFRDVNGQPVSYLRLFGLDEDAPVDQVDAAQIFQPGRDAFGRGNTTSTATPAQSIIGTFVIFPTREPFARPAPVPSARLNETDLRAALGNDLNPQIYDNPDPVERDRSGRFRLNFKYRLNVEGLVSTFSLGAFGLREASERIFIGDRQLTNGVDYSIDYDIGQLTLTDPAGLFSGAPDAQLRATWEQKALFQIAPTSVFGLNARYGLGKRGELNFVGLYQAEKTLMSRPQLGLEPSAIMLGGVSGTVNLGGQIIDRALARIPGLRVGAPSAMMITGELALSVPNPNTRGDAYLDDFESTDEISLPMSRRRWSLGSRPESTEHAGSVLPVPLDARTATRLVWQHDPAQNGVIGGSLLPRQRIDRAIVVAGNELPESVLWLTFGDSTPNLIGKRWRSMTTVLSTTGRDMSRSEYLEFYVWSSAIRGQTVVLDIGTVSEDAFYFDQNGQTSGTYTDGTRWGLGILDQEVRLADRELFSTDKDERGLWNRDCTANLQQLYPLGDPNANCARKNGEPDSEDLDGNGVLDGSDQAYFRYVVPVDDSSPYLVRNTAETGTDFRLFRVPLRTAGKPVNGASEGTWRFIKHLRMTVASSPVERENFVLARMRIVGSRWTKRDINGVLRGQISEQVSPTGAPDNVQVGPVSRLTDPDYSSPINVGDQLQDPSQRFGGAGIEFNEKSLRVEYSRIAPGDRGEVYYRYAQQPHGFMNYRQMRLWAIARRGSWGENGGMRLLIKVGNDPRNYYLYQAKLKQPVAGEVAPGDWLPEIVIDFEEWWKLRTRAEEVIGSAPTPNGQPQAIWSADSTYAVVLEDRARAPNLAALRELSFAVYNAGNAFADGEVWIDDMRLDAAFKDPGTAGTVTMDLRGGDFITGSLTYANQGAVFRQLNQDSRYQATGDLSVATTAQLGNFLPSSWALDVPFTVSHARAALDPVFLEGSDLRAVGLNGLRDTDSDATRFNLSLRKRTPSANPWVGLLVDGLVLRAGYNSAKSSGITTRSDAKGLDGGISYTRDLQPRALDVTPTFVENAFRLLLPVRVEQSDFFKRLAGSKLRWSPERISFGTSYFDQERRSYQFNGILVTDADSTVKPIESPRQGLENDAQIAFAPFQPLRLTAGFRQSRDLLAAERASIQNTERSAIAAARQRVGGLDVGWETNRSLSSEIGYRPEIAAWLKPSFTYAARYGTDRNPSYLEVRADSTAEMQRRFQADRTVAKSLLFEPATLTNALRSVPAQGTLPDSVLKSMNALGRYGYKLATALQPIELNWNSTLGSQFERELAAPRLGYQFGLGSFQDYRLIGGDTAIYVNQRDGFSARSGVRLPFNAMLNASYEENTLDAVDQRGGNRAENERRWPIANLTWSRLPLPKSFAKVILGSNLSLGHSKSNRTSVLGSLIDQDRGGTDLENRGSLVLTLAGGLTANYTVRNVNGTSRDPTGNSEQDGSNQNLQLGGSFMLPESFSEKFKAPISVTVGFTQDSQEQCRFRTAAFGEENTAQECVPFVSFQNRAINANLHTMITDVTVGMQLSYTSRQSFVGTRNGNNQFQLQFFGEFNMLAGRDLTKSGVR